MRHTSLKIKPSSGLAWFWALALIIAPMSYVLFISFMGRGVYGGVVFHPQIGNYAKVFQPGQSSLIALSFLRSVGVALVTTVICLFLAIPLAYFLVFKSGKWRSILFFLLIVPFWTQFLIRVYAWMVVFSDSGIVSKVFGVNWLFTYQAIFIGMVYNYLPYMTMSLYVNMEKIDKTLLDAANDLGASTFTKFKDVILPLSLPGIVAGSVMVFIPALGEFVIPDILGGAKRLFVGNLLAQQFLNARDWPFGSALSVLLMVVVVLSFYGFSKLSKGEELENLV